MDEKKYNKAPGEQSSLTQGQWRKQKQIGFLLGAGTLFMPLIFAWFAGSAVADSRAQAKEKSAPHGIVWVIEDRPLGHCKKVTSGADAFGWAKSMQSVGNKLKRWQGRGGKCSVNNMGGDGVALDCGAPSPINYIFNTQESCNKMEAVVKKAYPNN